MNPAPKTERALWQDLAARGEVQGDFSDVVGAAATPWAVRLLMGTAGWLGALFFVAFMFATVFAATHGGVAVALTGAAMIVFAVLLYRRGGSGVALGQFALAASLAGQGLVVFGMAQALGGNAAESATFWFGVAMLQGALYAVVPNRLHRFLAALGAWCALWVGLELALAGDFRHAWSGLFRSLGWLAPLACALAIVFTMDEGRLCAAGRHGRFEPAADATLLFALGASLLLTGTHHPLWVLDEPVRGMGPAAYWLPGALIAAMLIAAARHECRRLGTDARTTTVVLPAAALFGALMAAAPAVGAGTLAIGLALRRGSLPWLGLGVAAVGIGFVWYYSALHWTLLAKSATLAAAGIVLLACRVWLRRADRQTAPARVEGEEA